MKFRKDTIPVTLIKKTNVLFQKYVFISRSPVQHDGIKEKVEVISLFELFKEF